MPSQLYCSGPGHIFIGFPGRTPVYLGTCRETPRLQILRKYREVQNDISGDVPLDLSYMGQLAHLNFDLTRWDEAVYSGIAAFPHSPGARGVDLLGDMGTLMITEGQALGVWVQFPYSTKPAMTPGPMPAGYRFPFCFPVGPDDLAELGTRPRRLNLQFLAIRGYNPADGSQFLYDHDMSAIANSPVT